MKRWVLALPLLLLPSQAQAQAKCEGGTCVASEDLKAFLQLAKDQKCRAEKAPVFKLDPVTIVIDKDGRVFGSGADPKPYTVHIDWCNYQIDGKGEVKLVAAQKVEPEWGFRFRFKAALGLLPIESIQKKSLKEGLEGGVLVEPFFWKVLNVNAYVGFRSFGGGIGVDITKNFGFYAGYANTWLSWDSNVFTALYFSFN